jgi:esterase/lipase
VTNLARRTVAAVTGVRSWPIWLTCLLVACALPNQPDSRHATTGIIIPPPSADFAAYVETTRSRVTRASEVNGTSFAAPDTVTDRAPFELTPSATCPRRTDGRYQRGALLIHDLGGTPYVLRDVGQRLADACYLVRAILLPGHGTTPGDLLTVDREAWRVAVQQGVASFEGQVAELDLVGFSEGAGLALDYANRQVPPGDIALGALVLLSPIVAPSSMRVLTLLATLAPDETWANVGPDLDLLRYDSLPRRAVFQMEELLGELADAGYLLDVPIFVAISADDAEVDALGVRRWFCRRLIGPRDLIWYAREPDPVTDCRFVTVRTVVLGNGVLDLSHRAVPVAPDNPRYGRNATSYDCGHYHSEQDIRTWLRCLDPASTPDNSSIRYGEISPENLQRHVVRRLTYNPDFGSLTIDILTFLAAVPRIPRGEARPASGS